jgi:hypothetical protein
LRKKSASKTIKYLGINLMKETKTKDLFNENYKPLKREIKEDGKWRDLPCLWIGRVHCENGHTTKSNLSLSLPLSLFLSACVQLSLFVSFLKTIFYKYRHLRDILFSSS